jgi:threonine dehydrogenase-like Zn-dependent dehydrogenase
MLGVQRGLDVHVLDRTTTGRKPALVGQLGATYHSGAVADLPVRADVVIEATGAGQLVFDVLQHTAKNAITCLTGISGSTRTLPIGAEALNKELVLDNDVVFGSVNANRRHYELAAQALARADAAWLEQLVTRTVPLASWPDALQKADGDVKVVVDLQAG